MSTGRYQLIRSLAAGGMAEVFLARVEGAAGFSKLVALKRIHANLADDNSFVERFIDEARIASQLNHPNIVQILDLGVAEGSYFIAMEYVHGKTVWDLCREAARRQTQLPIEVALGIIVSACEGLSFAHDRRGSDGALLGIVHRDVSPQNVLVSFDGAVKVADFGIARAAGRVHKTEPGAVVGKLSYMAPEQMLGKVLDQRTDLYALGVMLHELLTGAKLFQTADLDPARRKVPAAPSMLNPAVSPALDAITVRALAPKPDDRYPTCDVLRTDLEAVMTSQGMLNSSRRRADLMQAWFPEDRVPPVDPGPAPQRSSTSTLELEKTPIQLRASDVQREAQQSSIATVIAYAPRKPAAGDVTSALRQLAAVPSEPTAVQKAVAVPLSIAHELDRALAQTPTPDAKRSGTRYVLGGGVLATIAALVYLGLHEPPAPARPELVVAPKIEAPPTPEAPAPHNVEEPTATKTKKVVAKRGALTIAVTPSVQVYAGRTLLGRTPLTQVAVAAGHTRLRLVSRDVGIDQSLDVDVRAGESVTRTLVIGKARLRIKASPWAAVTIDGNDLGTTPLAPQSLYAGSHVVTLTYKPAGAPPKVKRETLTLKEGEDRLLEADLK